MHATGRLHFGRSRSALFKYYEANDKLYTIPVLLHRLLSLTSYIRYMEYFTFMDPFDSSGTRYSPSRKIAYGSKPLISGGMKRLKNRQDHPPKSSTKIVNPFFQRYWWTVGYSKVQPRGWSPLEALQTDGSIKKLLSSVLRLSLGLKIIRKKTWNSSTIFGIRLLMQLRWLRVTYNILYSDF